MPSHSPAEITPSIFGGVTVACTASDSFVSWARRSGAVRAKPRRKRVGTKRVRGMQGAKRSRGGDGSKTAHASKGYRPSGNFFATNGWGRAVQGTSNLADYLCDRAEAGFNPSE